MERGTDRGISLRGPRLVFLTPNPSPEGRGALPHNSVKCLRGSAARRYFIRDRPGNIRRLPAATPFHLNRPGVNPWRVREATDEGRCFPGRSTGRGDGFPRSLPRTGRSGSGDQGQRHVRQRPALLPAAQSAESLGISADGSPVIAGHEPCGVVVARGGKVPDGIAPLGSRVMCHHYRGCGICATCRSGWQQLCREGIEVYGVTAHGAHAPYMKAAADTMVPLPESLSFAAGAAISCGTGTAIRRAGENALDRSRHAGGVRPGAGRTERGDVRGRDGGGVVALDISRERLALARGFGADECIDASDGDPIPMLRSSPGAKASPWPSIAAARPQARIQAVRSTRTWGTVCFVGEGGTLTLDVSQGPAAPSTDPHRVLDLLQCGAIGVRELRGRARHRPGAHIHPPLLARSGRRGVSPLRPANDGQGPVRALARLRLGPTRHVSKPTVLWRSHSQHATRSLEPSIHETPLQELGSTVKIDAARGV